MKNIEGVLEKIFRLAGRVQCEVQAAGGEWALTRFADNVISQNVTSAETKYIVRLLDGGRSAKVSFNQAGDADLKRAVNACLENLKRQKKDPALLPLPKTKALPAGQKLYFEETAALSPVWRAERAGELARACRKAGQTACGTVENGGRELVVANNLGLLARYRDSLSGYSVTVRDRDGFGAAERYDFAAGRIPFKELNETARAKAAASRSPKELKPGRYAVVLEPQAAADLISFICLHALGGRAYAEGRSFACGNLGKRVFSPLLTLEENALDGAAPGMPFDYEGQPRSRLTLVDGGVLKAVTHDRKTAKKCGAVSTGHAVTEPDYHGPVPRNVAVKPGGGTLADLIKGTERGLLITQFHYTNLLKAQTVEMTGMTRNGTFLIENGRVKRPVMNLRFTQSMTAAFAGISAIAADAVPVMGCGLMSCPSLRLDSLNFSSSTKF